MTRVTPEVSKTRIMVSCLQSPRSSHQPDVDWKIRRTFDRSKWTEKEKRRSSKKSAAFIASRWSKMRILIVGGGIGGCDWKSWEVWKQCERRRPSYGFTRHQSIPSLGVPFAEDSLIHENYITCGQIQSRSEDFTCKHHLLALQARSPKSCVRRRESNLQIRSDSPKAPSKDFSSRIHCLAATFSRPDTHSDPDATLCQTSGRGDVDGQIFQFCGDPM